MPLENWDIHKIRYTIVTSKKPVIVLFWMPKCRPCKFQEQILEELADRYGDEAIFVKCRGDEYPADDINQISLPAIPTTMINTYLEGKSETGKVFGVFPAIADKDKLIEEIDAAIEEMEQHYAEEEN